METTRVYRDSIGYIMVYYRDYSILLSKAVLSQHLGDQAASQSAMSDGPRCP